VRVPPDRGIRATLYCNGELDARSDMLLPFEGSGVDTSWEFRLPPAANPLDFASVVDLLVTVGCTAAYDDGQRPGDHQAQHRPGVQPGQAPGALIGSSGPHAREHLTGT
jgi:hypothetical protein